METKIAWIVRGCLGAFALAAAGLAHAAPTDGYTEYSDTYTVQYPYNLQQSDRFSVTSGPEYNCWIYSTDKPYSSGSTTGPRCEMRWAANWSSGHRFFDADVMIDSGSENTCIHQIKSNDGYEPIYVVVKNNGNLYNDNDGTVLATGMFGKWFHLTTDYNTSTGVGHVWINGVLKYTRTEKVSTTWYFKNGVYNTDNFSRTHFKNIKFYK